MKRWVPAAIAAVAGLALALPVPARSATQADIARGRLLVVYGHCNDCHTPGWIEADGALPVTRWLTGASIGFLGPWGTVYPTNLRLRFQQVSESQWLFMVKTRGGHPPMTWTDLRVLSVADQRAIYRFIHSLGPGGGEGPDNIPPGKQPNTPFYNITPQRPSQRQPL
jgi:hypothetical protein